MIRKVSLRTVVANNDRRRSLETSDVVVHKVPVECMLSATNDRPTDVPKPLGLEQHPVARHENRHAEVSSGPRRLAKTKAGNSLYLLNVGPDKSGRLPAGYVQRFKEIGTAR